MPKLLLPFLLAAAATPAIAAPDDHRPAFEPVNEQELARAEARKEREEAREQREATQQAPRVVEFRARSAAGPATAEAIGSADARDLETIRAARRETQRRIALASTGGAQLPDTAGTLGSGGGLRQSDRPLPRVLRNRLPAIGDSPRQGSEPPLRLESRRPRETNWSTGWRNDRRYDWWSWRSRHRSIFNVGDYYDPFGWGYRRYSVGRRLWPAYYGDPYWIQDPYYYRLPYAPAGYRWVRYYNDAVLIDTWDGRVADVVHNFFW